MPIDTGRAALWACGAIVGLLQAKGVISEGEITALASDLEAASGNMSGDLSPEIFYAARWLRQLAAPLGK